MPIPDSTAFPDTVSPTVSVTLPNTQNLVDLVEKEILRHGLPILVGVVIGTGGIYGFCRRYPQVFYIIVALCQFMWLVMKTPFLIIHQKLCPRRYRGAPPTLGEKQK